MFRTAIAYHLPSGWPWDAAGTAELLSRRTFQPCSPSQTESSGFVPPRDQTELCHEVHGRYLVCFQVEEKLLPSAVIQEHVDIRVADIEIEHFDAQFLLEASEIEQAYLALIDAHGGIQAPKRDDLVDRAEQERKAA